jgi:hypothetical protein
MNRISKEYSASASRLNLRFSEVHEIVTKELCPFFHKSMQKKKEEERLENDTNKGSFINWCKSIISFKSKKEISPEEEVLDQITDMLNKLKDRIDKMGREIIVFEQLFIQKIEELFEKTNELDPYFPLRIDRSVIDTVLTNKSTHENLFNKNYSPQANDENVKARVYENQIFDRNANFLSSLNNSMTSPNTYMTEYEDRKLNMQGNRSKIGTGSVPAKNLREINDDGSEISPPNTSCSPTKNIIQKCQLKTKIKLAFQTELSSVNGSPTM